MKLTNHHLTGYSKINEGGRVQHERNKKRRRAGRRDEDNLVCTAVHRLTVQKYMMSEVNTNRHYGMFFQIIV